MTDESRDAARDLSKVVARLFDQPEQTINAIQRIMERHGIHPTELRICIGGYDEIRELRQELTEAQAAVHRQFDTFEVACASKGYVGDTMMALAVNIEPGRIRNWRNIGRVPSIFFYKLSLAPDLAVLRQQEKERKKMQRIATLEAKKRLKHEAKRKEREARQKAREVKKQADRIGREAHRGAENLPIEFLRCLVTSRRDKLEGEELWTKFEAMALAMIEQTPLRINAQLLFELLRAQGYAVNNAQKSVMSRRFNNTHPDNPLFSIRAGDTADDLKLSEPAAG
jgi:hypothetical protein